jgi:serine/threonine-protein kinase
VETSAPDPTLGERIEHYEIKRPLCMGGMGRVYLARDTILGRQVAIKALAPTFLRNKLAVERFRHEAQCVAALDHPHIAPILHLIENEHGLFLVMPLFVESLRDRLERTPHLEVDVATRIISEVGSALSMAHAHRVIHRDVKPGNILLDHYGRAALADFGVACHEKDGSSRAADVPAESRTLVGTPLYMAPEQLSGEEVDPRADIYALGAVLYQMLTGQTPHSGNSLLAIATATFTQLIVPPSAFNPAVTPPVEAAILRSLAVRPEERYPDVTSFVTALQSAMTIPPAAKQELARIVTRPLLFPNWQSKLNGGQSGARVVQHRSRPRRLVAPALGAVTLLLALVGGMLQAGEAAGPFSVVDAITQSNARGFERHLILPSATSPSVTLTPTPSPVSTGARPSTPTSVTAVTPLLAISPVHLTKAHGNYCSGKQTIVNHSMHTLGWRWETTSLALHPSLVYEVNASAQIKGLPTDQDPGIPPGGAETVTVQMKCTGQTYTVTVRDSLGRAQQVRMTADH